MLNYPNKKKNRVAALKHLSIQKNNKKTKKYEDQCKPLTSRIIFCKPLSQVFPKTFRKRYK